MRSPMHVMLPNTSVDVPSAPETTASFASRVKMGAGCGDGDPEAADAEEEEGGGADLPLELARELHDLADPLDEALDGALVLDDVDPVPGNRHTFDGLGDVAADE